VYNLFSNFGNVEKIVKKAAQTYVMYTNFEFAVAAKEHLNGLDLFGATLTVEEAQESDMA
jgi:hypothetical protein